MTAARLWPIATCAFGLAAFAVLISFNLLPSVANAYPYGAFGPALSAFQRAESFDDLIALFGNPPDPGTLAAMTAGNQLDLFGFIPLYALFLASAAIMLGRGAKLGWLAIAFALIAAVADIVETSAQLRITGDWLNALDDLPYVAPSAWTKYFALAAHALACSAICFTGARKRWILGAGGLIPIVGVSVAYFDLVQVDSLMSTAFGVFWLALIGVAAADAARKS